MNGRLGIRPISVLLVQVTNRFNTSRQLLADDARIPSAYFFRCNLADKVTAKVATFSLGLFAGTMA
jgi:hypothetical protein